MVAVQNRMQGGMMLRSSQQGSFHSLTRGMSGHFQGNLMLAGGQKMARSGSVCSAGQAHTLGLQGLASNRSQSVSSGSAGQQGKLFTQQPSTPQHQQFIPAGQHAVQSRHQQRQGGQVFTTSSCQPGGSPCSHFQPTTSYHHLATPVSKVRKLQKKAKFKVQ